MPVSREDVIQAAVQLERDGREFYLEAAGNAASDLSKQTFESLADDELRHIEWIERISSAGETLESTNKRIYQRLRGIFADVPDEVRKAAASAAGDVEALNLAIGKEEESRAAYARWAKESDSDDVRELCGLLVGAEAFHRELLENVIQYLEHPSDFFLREERWVVEG